MTAHIRGRGLWTLIAGTVAVIAAGIAFAVLTVAPSPTGADVARHNAAERAPADPGPGVGRIPTGSQLTHPATAGLTTSPSPVGANVLTTSAATAEAEAVARAEASGCVTARLIGLPGSIPAGSSPVSFEGVIANHCGTDLPAVAPVFQIVGGPADHVEATLQQFDAASGTWQDTAMPEGDGGSPLTFAAHGSRLAPGRSLTLSYRLTVSSRNPAESTTSILYAVAVPGDTQLASTTARGRIGNG